MMLRSRVLIRLGRSVDLRLAALRADRGERGSAILTVFIFVILMLGISASLAALLVAQPSAVYTAERTTNTIYAAQAGLQASLGQLRTAVVAGKGEKSRLPCSTSGIAVKGSVDGTTASAAYEVRIRYFTTDPTPQPDSWRWNAANAIPCSGTAPSTVPRYALLRSTGVGATVAGLKDGEGDRTVEAIYIFDVIDVNIPGGPILDGAKAFCLEAASATAGAKISWRAVSGCTNDALTSWVYDTDYKLKLASSIAGVQLCITDPLDRTKETPPGTTTREAVLQVCDTGAGRWRQLWSWEGSQSWQGQKDPYTAGKSGSCLAYSSAASGQRLQVRPSCNGSFAPDLAVGPGASSKATNQIVNYLEFGRCFDVTNENITWSYMINYPCKQDPTGTGNELRWNHKFYYNEPTGGIGLSAPQTITVKDAGGTVYCLQASANNATPAYTVFRACTGGANQKWVRAGDTGDYKSSYLFTDTFGRCLDVDPTDLFAGFVSKVVMSACNGGLSQKWNAPPAAAGSEFGSFKEVG